MPEARWSPKTAPDTSTGVPVPASWQGRCAWPRYRPLADPANIRPGLKADADCQARTGGPGR